MNIVDAQKEGTWRYVRATKVVQTPNSVTWCGAHTVLVASNLVDLANVITIATTMPVPTRCVIVQHGMPPRTVVLVGMAHARPVKLVSIAEITRGVIVDIVIQSHRHVLRAILNISVLHTLRNKQNDHSLSNLVAS